MVQSLRKRASSNDLANVIGAEPSERRLITSRITEGRKPVLFHHISKAGGTMMCHLAEENGERIVSPHGNCNYEPWDDLGHLAQSMVAIRKGNHSKSEMLNIQKRVRMFEANDWSFGSIERPWLPLFDDDQTHFLYGTILREPVSLMLSATNYHGLNFKDVLSCYRSGNLTTMGQLCGDLGTPAWWARYDNFMTRSITGAWLPWSAAAPCEMLHSGCVEAGSMNSTYLDLAKQALYHRFSFTVALEDFDKHTPALFRLLGWSRTLSGIVNKDEHAKSNKGWTDVTFTSEDEATLRELNQYDVELYGHVRNQGGLILNAWDS